MHLFIQAQFQPAKQLNFIGTVPFIQMFSDKKESIVVSGQKKAVGVASQLLIFGSLVDLIDERP